MRRSMLLVVALLLLLAAPAGAQTPEPWLEGVAFPTNMAFAADGRLYFTEKSGAVRVVSPDGVLDPTPVLTLSVSTTGETGLLGIALHPSFTRGDPWMYLYLSDSTDGMNRLVRVRTDDDRAVGDPEQLLTTVPATNAYHNGGDLLFGPDGMLYVAVGEGHEQERAQDPNDVGGKVLRLNPDGEPAPGNPVAEQNPAFTIGHRNSFGLCADPKTGDIWETENGPDVDDEVNRLVPGGNYGWPEVTGDSGGRFADPISVFPDTVALTGCTWWRGELLVGSFNDGRVRLIDPGNGDAIEMYGFPDGVTDLLVGPDHALYVATAGAIWRASVPPSGSAPISVPPSSLGPDPIPPVDDGGNERTGWVAVAAAIALAVALMARVAAGRALRRSDDASDA